MAEEAEAKSSSERDAGTSHPPFYGRIEVDTVASVREGQADVKPRQCHCSTGIIVPGGEDSEPYVVARYLTVEREFCVLVRQPYAYCKSGFRE